MCSLFGLIDYKNCLTVKQKEKIIKVLAIACEVRGTDATGIAFVEDNEVKIYKQPLPAHRMKFNFKSNPKIIMGHTRMTTQGDEKFNFNNHPFYSEKLGFALAHNGVIYNDKELRKEETLPRTNIETDSFVAVQLIEKQRTLDFNSVKFMAKKIKGSFCFTILNEENEIYFVKGDNPLAIYDFGGWYIYASTEDILKVTLKKLKIKEKFEKVQMVMGDILKIGSDGEVSEGSFEVDDFGFSVFGYLRGYYDFGVNDEGEFEESYLGSIIEYAKVVGIEEDEVYELMEQGFDLFEIEEMLYDREFLEG